MKTFAFLPTSSLKKAYDGILIKYKRQDAFIDLLKIGVLFTVLCFSFFIYLRYVSLSSTRGYFLRKENQTLSNISFQYEILKTQLLDQKQKNRETTTTDANKREVVIVNTQMVNLPSQVELSINR